MKVYVSPAAATTVRSLPPETKRRLKAAILGLADDPLGARRGRDVKRFRTHARGLAYYRLRIGDWRAVYRILGERGEVIRVFPRREGYGWMDRLDY